MRNKHDNLADNKTNISLLIPVSLTYSGILFIMKGKYIPYTIILVFCVVTAIARIFLIGNSWSWQGHLLAFFVQLIFILALWAFIKYLSNFLDKRLPGEKKTAKKLMLQILISIAAIFPFYLIFISSLNRLVPAYVNRGFVFALSILFFVVIILLNIGSRSFYFFREWRKSIEEKAQLEVQAANLEREKSTMRYHHLKNQVNPHFLFNTFTSLDGLIQSNPPLASQFVRHLSKVYRYVLEHKEQEVVNLETELGFIEHYISILKIRYKEALEININISDEAKEKGIVMVTLQMLLDNAIKHNIVQSTAPLKIDIWDSNDNLCMKNNKQLRKQIETANGHGLTQLQELYSFITDRKVIIHNTGDSFEINIPLL